MKHMRPLPSSERGEVAQRFSAPHALAGLKLSRWFYGVSTILAGSSLLLWTCSLKHVDAYTMNDLGLISVLPTGIIIALVILLISFSLAMSQVPLRMPLIVVHILLLILFLYATQNFIEEAPRFSIVYRHAGYTEFIMRTGSANPALDAYFSWPGFFILSALLTHLAGYSDILAFAGWAPLVFNLLYGGPLYMLFSSLTTNRRLVMLGLWCFYLTNWIGQDYYSPQGFDFFMYLVFIAILVRWFKVTPVEHIRHCAWVQRHIPGSSAFLAYLARWITAPDMLMAPASTFQRRALLACLLVIFAFVVFSHPLTPFFMIASVIALVVFARTTPRWLPVVMVVMTGAWIFFMTRTFLAGHSWMVVGSVGKVSSSLSSNVTSRLTDGNPEHSFVALMRSVMTVLAWVLAACGSVRRLLRGQCDITILLLALVPFPLLVAQEYGGEMALRVYLFTLPAMVFLVAALFYPAHNLSAYRQSPFAIGAILLMSLLLLGGFFFTRYGNERMDYMTWDEVIGVRHAYAMAPPGSLLLQGWSDSPWQFRDYEKYDCHSLDDLFPDVVVTQDVKTITRYITEHPHVRSYILIGRTQKVTAESFSGLPPGSLDRLEVALVQSKQFQLVYNSRDLQFFQYVGNVKPVMKPAGGK